MKMIFYDKRRDEFANGLEDKYFEGCEIKHCSVFGCGKQLSMIESLSGNKCTEHLKVKRIDPMDVIKLK